MPNEGFCFKKGLEARSEPRSDQDLRTEKQLDSAQLPSIYINNYLYLQLPTFNNFWMFCPLTYFALNRSLLIWNA